MHEIGSVMKAVSYYRPYGWKATIGLIVPSTNTVMEPEFWKLAPPGVAVFTARATLLGAATTESYFRMAESVNDAAQQLATAEVDTVIYGCTSGSFVCPLPELLDNMRQRAGVPALASAGAVIAALRALQVDKVSLVTPYLDFVNEREIEFLKEHGVQTLRLKSFSMGETQEERRAIGKVPPQAIYRLAREADHPDAQAIFISCTNLPSLDVVDLLEKELGKPVITSNQASLWACLRRLGLRDAILDHGRLLSNCLDPVGDI